MIRKKRNIDRIKDVVASTWLAKRLTSMTLARAYEFWSTKSTGGKEYERLAALVQNKQDYLHKRMHLDYESQRLVWIYCGANSGHFLQFMKPGTRVICIEPQTELHQVISETSKNYGLHTEIIASAIGESNGQGTLHLNESSGLTSLGGMKSSYGITNFGSPVNQGIRRQQTTQILTLDQVIQDRGLKDEKFGLIIDVQGAELLVLRGLKDFKNQVDVAVIEISTQARYDLPWDLREVINWFLPEFTLWQVNPFLTMGENKAQVLNPLAAIMEMDLFFIRTNSEMRLRTR